MKKRIKIWHLGVISVIMFLLLQNVIFVSILYANNITIIGNKDVPVNALSINEIRSIFLGEKVKWHTNQRITFVILKSKEHEDFLGKYIGNTAAQYRNYWRKMVFTGKSRSPRSFNTPAELIDYVANNSGTIGYIPSEIYNDNDKVKIISVKKETNE